MLTTFLGRRLSHEVTFQPPTNYTTDNRTKIIKKIFPVLTNFNTIKHYDKGFI